MEDGSAEAPPVDHTAELHTKIDYSAAVIEIEASDEFDAPTNQSTTESDDEKFSYEEDYAEQSDEDRARLKHRRKMKRREQKRKADETLRRYYKQPEPAKEDITGTSSLNERISTEGEEETETNLWKVLDEEGEEEEDNKLSSSDEESDALRTVLPSFKGDFFDNFYFPSISDITTESEEETTQEPPQPTEEKEVDESGTERPPTAAVLTSEKESDLIQETQEDAVDETEDESASSTTISFDWPFPLEDEVAPIPKAAQAAFDMDILIEIASSMPDLEQVVETEAIAVDQVNRQICTEVLYKIIDDLVKSAEYVDPRKVLQAKLNKNLLIKELHKLISECMAAETFNMALSNKMHDYYRRVGQLRCFDVLPQNVVRDEWRRYKDAMSLLDHLRNKADKTKKAHVSLVSEVMSTLNIERAIALSTEDSLESCIRSILVRKDFAVLPRVVETDLRRMQLLRNEISDNRLFLITRQHTLAMVLERKCKLNQITPELTMDQFLNTQRDIIALGTKVEERNCELNRMRERCTKQVHLLAFIREKTSMLSASLISMKMSLNKKLNRVSVLRDNLLSLKLEHSNLKVRKATLVTKNGLLYKPGLLYDYDDTVELIERKKETVKKMRNTIQELEARLDLLLPYNRSPSYSADISTK